MQQPEGFKPEIICTKRSTDAKWKAMSVELRNMSREFVWPKVKVTQSSFLWHKVKPTSTIGTNILLPPAGAAVR